MFAGKRARPMRAQLGPELAPIGFLPDGTPYYAPLGQLPHDAVSDRVQCHICGRWYRGVGSHAWGSHGWTHDEYVEAFELSLGRPLAAPSVSEKKRAIMKHLYATDSDIRSNLAIGQEMFRDTRTRAQVARPTRDGMQLESLLKARRAIRKAIEVTIERAERRRAERLSALGYPDLDSFLVTRLERGASGHAMADELGVGASFVRQALKIRGLKVRSSPEAANEAQRERRRAEQQRVAYRLGFESFEAYLRQRLAEGCRLNRIAHEVGHHSEWLKAGCRDYGIEIPAFDAAENSRQAWAVARQRYSDITTERRAERLRRLGFPDLCSYLRDRFLDRGWRLKQIKAEIRMGSIDLQRAVEGCGLKSLKRSAVAVGSGSLPPHDSAKVTHRSLSPTPATFG